MPLKRNNTEYLEEMQFSNLVKDLDEKWSHTYKDPNETEQPEMTDEMRKIFDTIADMEGYYLPEEK